MEEYKDTMIPLGSIVELKSGNKAMIIGYAMKDEKTQKRYDYFGCDSVYGFIGGFKLFDSLDIKKVLFNGYNNDPLISLFNKKVKEELK